MLFAQGYFDRPGEAGDPRACRHGSMRASTGAGARRGRRLVALGWSPEKGHLPYDWIAYSEAMLVYILALGSPTHALGPESWPAWAAGLPKHWGTEEGQELVRFAPAVRPPVQPHLGRFPRHPRRLHARKRASTISRTAAARRSPSTPMRWRNPMRLERLRPAPVGPDRLRRPGRRHAEPRRPRPHLPHLCRARPGRLRRRHGRADRGRRVDALRAGDLHRGAEGDARAIMASTSTAAMASSTRSTPASPPQRAVEPRPARAGPRLVRQRLSRHRPGPDPGDDRESPQRPRLGGDARQSAHPPRPRARRLHRRLARHDAAAGSSLCCCAVAGCARRRRRPRGRPLLGDGPRRRGRRRADPGVRAAAPEHPRRAAADPLERGAREVAHRLRRRVTPDIAQLGLELGARAGRARRARADRQTRRGLAAVARGGLFHRHLGRQCHRRPHLGRALVCRHAPAVLPQRPAARRRALRRCPTIGPTGCRAMRAIKQRGAARDYAIFLPINEYEPLLALALQQPEPLLRDGGRYGNFRSPGFVRASEFYLDMFREGLAPRATNTQISNIHDEFARGHFAFIITGPWNIGEFKRRMPADRQDDWMTAPLPGPTGPGLSIAGGSSLGLFARSQHKAAAWKLVEYLSRPEVQAALLRADRRPAAAAQRVARAAAGLRPLRARLPRPARAHRSAARGARMGADRTADADRLGTRGGGADHAPRSSARRWTPTPTHAREAPLDAGARGGAMSALFDRRLGLRGAGDDHARPVLLRAGAARLRAQPDRFRSLRARQSRRFALHRLRQLCRAAADAFVLEGAGQHLLFRHRRRAAVDRFVARRGDAAERRGVEARRLVPHGVVRALSSPRWSPSR